MPLLGYLHGLGVVPCPPEVVPTADEVLVGEYRRYSKSERGLASTSVKRYLGVARLFLSQRPQIHHGTASRFTVVSQFQWRLSHGYKRQGPRRNILCHRSSPSRSFVLAALRALHLDRSHAGGRLAINEVLATCAFSLVGRGRLP